MRILPFLLLLLALASPLRADDPPAAVGLFEAHIYKAADGSTLPYRLLKPKDYSPDKKYPLIFFLHGAAERGDDNVIQLRVGVPLFVRDDVREKYPAFVLVPQCPAEQKWVDVDWSGDHPKQPEKVSAPMALALEILASVQKEYSVDPDRLYLNGISMGGYGTWDLMTRMPEKWAAAVPLSGGGDPAVAAKAKDIPTWAFHGILDPLVKFARSQEMVQGMTAAGGHPLFSEYPYVGHEAYAIAYAEPELVPWIFAQKRGQPQVPFAQIAGPFEQPPTNQFPGVGPTQSGMWFRGLWRAKREGWSKAVEADQGAVVFFGDSITQGWDALPSYFPGLKVANRGISGDTTRGLLERVDGDVLALKPKAVEILIGTNDLDQGAEPDAPLSNMKALVAKLHQARPEMPIILSRVMPRGAKEGFYPVKIEKLNALYQEAFGNDPLITFCDTWSLFNDGTGQVKVEEFPDRLHPNAAGYAKWAEALKPIFAKLKL